MTYKANDVQIGGIHYKQAKYQPWDVIEDWGLGFLDGNAVKYLARWRNKNGLEDLRKARHYLDKLIELEESKIDALLKSTQKPQKAAIEPQTLADEDWVAGY